MRRLTCFDAAIVEVRLITTALVAADYCKLLAVLLAWEAFLLTWRVLMFVCRPAFEA